MQFNRDNKIVLSLILLAIISIGISYANNDRKMSKQTKKEICPNRPGCICN
jgi:hypothetical protein